MPLLEYCNFFLKDLFLRQQFFNSCVFMSGSQNLPRPKVLWKPHYGNSQFENKEHPFRGFYRTFLKKFLFKFPFSHKRFQMGQKMYFYQLYKL